MPSALTHYLFAKDVVNQVQFDFKLNRNLTYIGSQGPDVLFYLSLNVFSSDKNNKERSSFGSTLHKSVPTTDFVKMIEYASKQETFIKDQLFSYIIGAMFHYILDQVFHPFVYYRTGFTLGEDTYNYTVDHFKYESMLDFEFLSHNKTNARKIRGYRVIHARNNSIYYVSKMFGTIYEELTINSFSKSWKNMKRVQKLLFDRFGFKRGFLGLIKSTNNHIYSLMIPLKKDKNDHIDYLNMNHDEWKNPSSLKIYHEDAFQLYNYAINKAKNACELIKQAYLGKNIMTELSKISEDKNYLGINYKGRMKEFKSVYKQSLS